MACTKEGVLYDVISWNQSFVSIGNSKLESELVVIQIYKLYFPSCNVLLCVGYGLVLAMHIWIRVWIEQQRGTNFERECSFVYAF